MSGSRHDQAPAAHAGGDEWAEAWFAAVLDGRSTMSQRSLRSIETRGGGVERVRALARLKGVHLLLLEDDTGTQVVAASLKPFEVLT